MLDVSASNGTTVLAARLKSSGALWLAVLVAACALLVGVVVRARRSHTPPSAHALAHPHRAPMAHGPGAGSTDPLGIGLTDALPRRVYVGVFVTHVPQLDLASNAYLMDFWLWFRWRGSDIDPSQTFEFVNGFESWDALKQPVFTDDEGRPKPEDLGDGWRYQALHIQGRFSHPFDVRAYPFDRQALSVSVEDTDADVHHLVYVPDPGTHTVDPALQIPGWRLLGATADVTEAHYPTNFGDIRRPAGEDHYTRFTYTIHIGRPVLGYLATTMVPISIVILITFIVFLIPSRYFEGRLGLGITSLISAVALQLTAAGDLPKSGDLVLLDHVYNLSYLVIFIATLESVAAVRLADSDREEASRKLDRWTLCVSAVLYFGVLAWLVLRAA